jgi:hypothetical protein
MTTVRQVIKAEGIARRIVAEMLDAAKSDGVRFDGEQVGFIRQALFDAALEAFRQIASELRETAGIAKAEGRA